jgi:hypothetical protein
MLPGGTFSLDKNLIKKGLFFSLTKAGYLVKYLLTSGAISSAGRASALQAEGHRFEPCIAHQIFCNKVLAFERYMGA